VFSCSTPASLRSPGPPPFSRSSTAPPCHRQAFRSPGPAQLVFSQPVACAPLTRSAPCDSRPN
jgi:hypothetical protein